MIKLMRNTFYNENEVKQKLCDFIMKSEKLSMGNKCLEFEEDFAKYQGRKYAVLFNSGSSANLALIQALLNLKILTFGDSVGFSCVTWSTNVMPLIQLGLNPVPIDISIDNLNINSENLLETISTEKIRALFLTNLLGFCGDIDKIKKICEERKIIFLEDNCESLGSTLNNKKLGNFGLASTFSFFVGHHLSTIEGGFVCTDNKEVYDMLKIVREHGWSRNLDEKTREELKNKNGIDEFHERYAFYSPGYNIRPTEITGFIGIEQLKFLDETIKIRNKNFLDFYKEMRNNDKFFKLNVNHMDFISNFAFPIISKDRETFERTRKSFEKIAEIRPIVGGCMISQPFFKEYLEKKGKRYSCPNSEKMDKTGFYFPNDPEMTLNEREKLINLLKEINR